MTRKDVLHAYKVIWIDFRTKQTTSTGQNKPDRTKQTRLTGKKKQGRSRDQDSGLEDSEPAEDSELEYSEPGAISHRSEFFSNILH